MILFHIETKPEIMSAEIVDNTAGVLTIQISGKLRQPELAAAQKAAAESLQKQGASRLLVLAQNFQGWEKRGDWGDLSGQMQLDAQIDRMAIVGDKRWEDLALVFAGKGIRRVVIEYFLPSESSKARSWLAGTK
jgi:hypothetical protein